MFMNMTDVNPLATMMMGGHHHLNLNVRYSHPRAPLPSPPPASLLPLFFPRFPNFEGSVQVWMMMMDDISAFDYHLIYTPSSSPPSFSHVLGLKR